MQTVKISVLKPNSNVEIEFEQELTIQELAQAITKRTWSPAVYKDQYRNKENAYHSDLFAIDVDEGCTLDKAQELFEDYWHIIGTTRSHQKEKNGVVADRFRVILLLDQPMKSDLDCKKTFKYLQDKFGFLDEACKDISRLFYPCTEIVSVNDDVLGTVPDCSEVDLGPSQDAGLKIDSSGGAAGGDLRGRLLADNMDFFLRGAPHGERNTRLFQAASDAREQGYRKDELIEMIHDMGERNSIDSFFPDIDPKHMATLDRVFKTPSTNPIRLESPTTENKRVLSMADVLRQTWGYLDDKDKIKGDSTGIPGLDDLFGGGFRLGEITVLQGEAKTGKNTLYHQIQFHMLQRGIGQGYASRELDPAEEVAPNFISLYSKRNAWLDTFPDTDRESITNELSSWPLFYLPGYGSINWEETKDWMDFLLYQGIKHFWFDHLHYMLEDEDYKAASRLMKNLKTYAKTNKVHINLIVQPTKIGSDERVGLNSLKGGAAVGQALDNLLLFSRTQPSDAAAPIQNCSCLELSHARHKIARTGKIYLQYDPNTTWYTELRKYDKAPDQQAERVQAYKNFENKMGNGIQNKWRVNSSKSEYGILTPLFGFGKMTPICL